MMSSDCDWLKHCLNSLVQKYTGWFSFWTEWFERKKSRFSVISGTLIGGSYPSAVGVFYISSRLGKQKVEIATLETRRQGWVFIQKKKVIRFD